jgi:DNA-binding HxlR family transcriptional regulator
MARRSRRPVRVSVGAVRSARPLRSSGLPGSPTMAPMRQLPQAGSASPLGSALDLVGDRWTLLVVEALLDGPRRFNELVEALSGIAPNILSERLRRLERAGIVVAAPYSQRPPRMEYSLTADGRDLTSALRLLADWGARHAPAGLDAHEPVSHAACGTPLQARWYCPTCELALSDAEVPDDRKV